jgi:hypothetical protein
MKGYLKALRVTNYVWLALIFLILILAAVPAIPGAVQVKLPSEWKTTDSGGRINITGEVQICNGGIFSLDDFYFSVMLISDSGGSLASFESEKVDLKPGPWIKFPVSFEVEDVSTASADVQDLFFSKVTFTSMLYFTASYILGFKVETVVIGSTSLGPLVRDFEVHTNQTTVHEEDGLYWMEVPYNIDTSFLLTGSNLYVFGLVSNDTDCLGIFNTTASLGGYSSGTLSILLTYDEYYHLSTSPDTLLMECLMEFGPFDWEQNLTIAWDPPDRENGHDILPPPQSGSVAVAALEG